MPHKTFTFTVRAENEGQRLDQWLAGEMGEDSSRSEIQRWIATGSVQPPRPKNHRLVPGEVFKVQATPRSGAALKATPIDFGVVYEDEFLAVVHKPPGIAVHPGPGEERISLVHGLLYRWPHLPESDAGPRPGIVHRLDRDTEGLLVVALRQGTRRKLSALFAQRQVEKEYLAWTGGAPPSPSGEIEAPIKRHPVRRTRMCVDPGGRSAKTGYFVERTVTSKRGRKYARLRVELHTGRTHQIRVHLAHLKCPVVGDPFYSKNSGEFQDFGLLLLARRLAFIHPETDELLALELEEPRRFLDFENRAAAL